jgi:hypothetical protein
MSEMVHRVARAIASHSGISDRRALDYIPEARLAIAAMREPTEAMCEACFAVSPAGWPRVIWPAMIDAALAE